MRRVCLTCGREYEGDPSSITCPECVAAKKKTTMAPRVCRVCGRSFMGGPSAPYCPECRIEKRRERDRKQRAKKKAGAVRKLGSIDTCIACGKEYIVTGSLQKYCPSCAPIEIAKKDAAKSREWNAANLPPEKRRQQREEATALITCVVCGKPFAPSSSAKTCSPECSAELARRKSAKFERDHKAARTQYKRERHAARLAAMTPEEREDYRKKVNARARENYRKRKDREKG